MNSPTSRKPSFWAAVRLLLGATRKRAAGRRRRQRELLNNRTGKNSTDWGRLGLVFPVLFMAVINVGAAFVVESAVTSSERVEAERSGKIVVSDRFFWARADTPKEWRYSSEARQIAEKYGGTQSAIEQRLRETVRDHGTHNLISIDEAAPGITGLPSAGPLTAMFGSVVLLWWAMMLVFQGEGLELDLQRRRHPMWEWLFSHPIPPGAVFFAEMLSPIAANPLYWSAPLFAGVLYGFIYGFKLGFLAVILIGIPITIAAACLGKALENAVVLRLAPRSRGATLGIMGWLGNASMMLFIVAAFVVPKLVTVLSRYVNLFTVLPWPWLRLFLGGHTGSQANGAFSFLSGMLTCWIAAAVTVAAAVWFSVWSTQQGLSGNFTAADSRPSAPRAGAVRFGKEPLYRKELLWFSRDRSAIVQTILVPLSVASLQVFNLRHVLSNAQGAWNYLCGVAIFFGTYFLWILGPKSLASEGSALWIALTWPRGLESLLKAKAWLWSLISSAIVALVLAYTAFLFPSDIWKIALIGAGWLFFGRSMAEKSVTLVSVTSSSGEVEKIPAGRRWAAQLGMLTFAIGVLTQQWHIAIMGIVYSYLTAAAMWENFRARLPFLYDPWSETLPPPPTLMHAMISISILVECGAILTGIILAFAGRENIAIAQAISYCLCSVAVAIGVSNFLDNRGVHSRDVWSWRTSAAAGANEPEPQPEPQIEPQPESWWRTLGFGDTRFSLALLTGASGGLLLGFFARGYLAVLGRLPATADLLHKSQQQMAAIPNLRISYAVMGILFAPFAEEYLFRGLLFRALDREWGGWRAIVGSAAFFAIYHPPLSWLPVAVLGIANAILFKKTGRLAPAVILHMVYNAVVLL
jgi:membrane protease YdiL (CAAX protease family)